MFFSARATTLSYRRRGSASAFLSAHQSHDWHGSSEMVVQTSHMMKKSLLPLSSYLTNTLHFLISPSPPPLSFGSAATGASCWNRRQRLGITCRKMSNISTCASSSLPVTSDRRPPQNSTETETSRANNDVSSLADCIQHWIQR
jgi:hypothetical protein